MLPNRRVGGGGAAIVEEELAQSQAPEWCGAEVPAVGASLNHAIAQSCTKIMCQQVRVEVRGAVCQCRHGAVARLQRGNMARRAPNPREYLASPYARECCWCRIGRGEQAHKVRKELQVLAIVFGLRYNIIECLALRQEVNGEHRGGDSHLIEIGIGGEVLQSRHLRLPAKAPDLPLARDRADGVVRDASDAIRIAALDVLENLAVRDGLHQPCPKERRGDAPRDILRPRRHHFRRNRAGGIKLRDRAALNDGPAQRN